MKLNANEFRKNLEDARKQKKQADASFLRMQLDLQASVDSRNQYLNRLCSIALDAALNGHEEVGFDENNPPEYVDYLKTVGFEIDEREIEADSLLRKVREIPPKNLKALESRLRGELSKMIKIAAPQKDSDLLDAYNEYINADDELDIQVKHLLKVIALYNTEYSENSEFSLEADAKLWLYLSRLQDVINLYDPENDTEECVLPFLCWSDECIEMDDVPPDDSPHSMLNPEKLRFINSGDGEAMFAKISDDMRFQAQALKSFTQFDLIVDTDGAHIIFPDASTYAVKFSPLDLQLIFQKRGFKATFKYRRVGGSEQVAAFKVKF